MNFNGIGSILSANESQFISLYKQTQFKGDTQDGFVEEYKSKQEIALKDAEELQQFGITPQQIGEKLYRIVEKANNAYKSNIDTQPINLFSPDFKRPVIDVDEDGSFSVSGFDLREMRHDECALCDHKVSGPATYQIENLQTHEIIRFPELTLHLIRSHEYFAKPGHYRLDPSKVCKVLDLLK